MMLNTLSEPREGGFSAVKQLGHFLYGQKGAISIRRGVFG